MVQITVETRVMSPQQQISPSPIAVLSWQTTLTATKVANLEASSLQYPTMPINLSEHGRHRRTQDRCVSGGCVVCQRCKQQGHYAKGCASARTHKATIPIDNQGSEEHKTCTIAINSVISCHLKGEMFNNPVSFLIDRSIAAKWRNLDKKEPSNINIEATKFHNWLEWMATYVKSVEQPDSLKYCRSGIPTGVYYYRWHYCWGHFGHGRE